MTKIKGLAINKLYLLGQPIGLLLGNLLLCSLPVGAFLLDNLLKENLLVSVIQQKNYIKAVKGKSRHFEQFIESGMRWNPINAIC